MTRPKKRLKGGEKLDKSNYLSYIPKRFRQFRNNIGQKRQRARGERGEIRNFFGNFSIFY